LVLPQLSLQQKLIFLVEMDLDESANQPDWRINKKER
jgi:hypothetical protein